jgi:hypothetical protein
VFRNDTRRFSDHNDLIGFKKDIDGGHGVFSMMEGKSSSI